MPDPDPRQLWPVVVSALQLVAAEAGEQVAALPAFVHVPDEVALTFDDAMALVPHLLAAGLLDDAAVAQLVALDTALQAITVWSVAALHDEAAWHDVRQRARALCRQLGLARGPIDLSWGVYVPGRPSRRPRP